MTITEIEQLAQQEWAIVEPYLKEKGIIIRYPIPSKYAICENPKFPDRASGLAWDVISVNSRINHLKMLFNVN